MVKIWINKQSTHHPVLAWHLGFFYSRWCRRGSARPTISCVCFIRLSGNFISKNLWHSSYTNVVPDKRSLQLTAKAWEQKTLLFKIVRLKMNRANHWIFWRLQMCSLRAYKINPKLSLMSCSWIFIIPVRYPVYWNPFLLAFFVAASINNANVRHFIPLPLQSTDLCVSTVL